MAFEPLVQPLDLDAQLGAQLRVEIRERLVEQEHAGLAHQRAADRDALALAAGQLGRLAVEQLGDLAASAAACVDAPLDLRRGRPATCRPNDMLPRAVMRG